MLRTCTMSSSPSSKKHKIRYLYVYYSYQVVSTRLFGLGLFLLFVCSWERTCHLFSQLSGELLQDKISLESMYLLLQELCTAAHHNTGIKTLFWRVWQHPEQVNHFTAHNMLSLEDGRAREGVLQPDLLKEKELNKSIPVCILFLCL